MRAMGLREVEVGVWNSAVSRVFAEACADLTVRDLRERTGTSIGRVSDLLNGKAKWYVEDLARFAEACGLSVRTVVQRAEAIVYPADDLSDRRARKSTRTRPSGKAVAKATPEPGDRDPVPGP